MPTFETQGGTAPGVTILNADGTVHTAHTTLGFTEAVAGSSVYNYPHPSPGTLLEFVFDATVGGGTLYASVWDDGLTTIPARAGDAMTLTAGYDATKNAMQTDDASVAAILQDTGTTIPALIAGDVPAGYTRVSSATYGPLLPGTVIDAYASTDTTYATPLVPNVTVASNGSWHIDLPDAGSYTLVARLAGHDTVTEAVTT